ncbi:dolichol phosphate-mannose biosynthesis regulatory protein (macronuclear) [Tetrahymena thermophila SB210]|uniref:Dolichol phosphate-mannose biosynthesis regulatory protein n=1 Tax=Tetrahymena thermophila (strain SB210) TaxID=312017 RepID=W7XKQ1_TETTS|nr:dolichol phosphate-mannose biosynthesis regulatory protein [Tetrahymena thermophila SB210]EWS75109.1 dolichol phosphate-mannose biosynthesis regulatory protein [Tetrahymena thermophila SB210]|eukprot:XP_012652347.1 dolichol phosphate-mannose biosynthesis regulatory protein [Tetrahymena thermophila SB210]
MQIQTIGKIGLATVTSFYIYYLVWVLITPFIDANHKVQSYFPHRDYAYMIPTVLIIFIVSIFFTFIGLVLITPSKKQITAPQNVKVKNSE